jgi:uncharacterized RDD family membrane protein YckC
MAYCANCGHEISELAETCPKCGHRTAGTTARLHPADFWTRFAALLLDSLILIVPEIVVGLLLPFGGFAVWFLYNWLMLAYNNGQTVGKAVLKIRILRPDTSPIDEGTAAARAGMSLVSSLPFGLGYLWAAWDPDRRTWHDMVANTRAFRVG